MPSDTELMSLVSRGLYRILSEEIGPESVVKLRREEWDTLNILKNCGQFDKLTWIMSGSTAEGLEMKSSDTDVMMVLNDIVVVPSYHPLPQGSCVLIYDTDYTSPGFVVIRCNFLDEVNMTFSHRLISRSLVWNSLGPCVCSKLLKEDLLIAWPSTEIHGPCISGEILGREFDAAFCLQCPYWPREASSFITRSFRSGWPSKQVVTDIINDGCLFVPISGKSLHCQDALEMEWRMSFSLAEKKLVFSMNHCQFLCYGLLKLFLNEVLKQTENINDLLCSYFMKTAVFWEISEDKSDWTSQNFLCKFWKTFRRLLGWVYVGYCPNFFNPGNNMFAGKIHGHKQRLLVQVLRSFHSEGVLCLLKCSSLNTKLVMLLEQMMISRQLNIVNFFLLPLNDELHVHQWYLDFRKVRRITSTTFPVLRDCRLSHALKRIRRIRNVVSTSSFTKAALKYGENKLLQMIGEIILAELATANYRSISNRAWKKYLHIALNIVCRSGTTFCDSEIIVAKWFFILGMFQTAIPILINVKTRLNGSQFMYWWSMNEAGLGRLQCPETSFNSFLKSNIANDVALTIQTTVSELLFELSVSFEDAIMPLFKIPPLVFVSFLLLLSYHHLGDAIRRNDVLRDLHALVWYDEDYHIHCTDRAISWEILGICQQLCGDYHGAYQSYINALNDEYSNFKRATITRIISLTNGL